MIETMNRIIQSQPHTNCQPVSRGRDILPGFCSCRAPHEKQFPSFKATKVFFTASHDPFSFKPADQSYIPHRTNHHTTKVPPNMKLRADIFFIRHHKQGWFHQKRLTAPKQHHEHSFQNNTGQILLVSRKSLPPRLK